MIRRLAVLDQGIVLMPGRSSPTGWPMAALSASCRNGARPPGLCADRNRLLPAKTQRFIDFLRDRLPDG